MCSVDEKRIAFWRDSERYQRGIDSNSSSDEELVTHLSPPPSPPLPTRSHYTGKKWNFKPFNSVINPHNCHVRRSKTLKTVKGETIIREEIFHQCTRKATEKHGYCQGCIDKSVERDSQFGTHTTHRVGLDGDIRIWGGIPEDHGRSIRDNAHGNWLAQCVCQGKILHYHKDIPEDIIRKYNLPRI